LVKYDKQVNHFRNFRVVTRVYTAVADGNELRCSVPSADLGTRWDTRTGTRFQNHATGAALLVSACPSL